MSARDELIVKYTDLKDKCGVSLNMDLLTKVTIGCGPSIYNKFLNGEAVKIRIRHSKTTIKKIGLKDGPDLDAGIGC
jgi:hypothetical protein